MNELPSLRSVFDLSLSAAKVSFPDAWDLTWKRVLLPSVPFFAIGIFCTALPPILLFLSLLIALIFGLCFTLPAEGGLMELALATVQVRDRRFESGYGGQILWVETLKALLFILYLLPLIIAKMILKGPIISTLISAMNSVASQGLQNRYCLTIPILIAEDSGSRAILESWRLGRGNGLRLTLYAFAIDAPILILTAILLAATPDGAFFLHHPHWRHLHEIIPDLPKLFTTMAIMLLPSTLFTSLFQPFFLAALYQYIRGVPQVEEVDSMPMEGV